MLLCLDVAAESDSCDGKSFVGLGYVVVIIFQPIEVCDNRDHNSQRMDDEQLVWGVGTTQTYPRPTLYHKQCSSQVRNEAHMKPINFFLLEVFLPSNIIITSPFLHVAGSIFCWT